MRSFPEVISEPEFDPRSIFTNRNDSLDVDAICDDGTYSVKYDWDEATNESYSCSGKIIDSNATIGPTVHSAWIPPAYSVSLAVHCDDCRNGAQSLLYFF